MDKISRTFTIQVNWKEIQYNRTEVSEGLDSLVSCELIWVEDTTSETFVIQKSVEYCIPPKNTESTGMYLKTAHTTWWQVIYSRKASLQPGWT